MRFSAWSARAMVAPAPACLVALVGEPLTAPLRRALAAAGCAVTTRPKAGVAFAVVHTGRARSLPARARVPAERFIWCCAGEVAAPAAAEAVRRGAYDVISGAA